MSSLHQADVSESESDQSRLSASGSFHSFLQNPPYAAHSDSSASRPCAFLEKERDHLVRDHDLHLREIRRLNVKIEELETKESGMAVPSTGGGTADSSETEGVGEVGSNSNGNKKRKRVATKEEFDMRAMLDRAKRLCGV